jgi:basic membrane lipoprotein Med (substrate-binding protein (PBP1-ABC) superfamily)
MYLGFNPANNHSVVMTSMLKRVDLAVYAQFERIHLETWSGGIYIGNLANHMVGYELNSTEVEFPQAVYTTLYSLENSIADGTLIVPDHKYW